MKLNDIYWLAGLIEGEGYFYHQDGYPCLGVKMTDLDVIQKVVKLIKSDNTIQVIEPKDEKHKIAYQTRFTGQIAVQWMLTIYPLMSLRRQAKIRELIKEWKMIEFNVLLKKYNKRIRSNSK